MPPRKQVAATVAHPINTAVPVEIVKEEDIHAIKQPIDGQPTRKVTKTGKRTKKVVEESSVASPVVEEEDKNIIEENLDIVNEGEEVQDVVEEKKRNRRVVSKETFYRDFESLFDTFGEDISSRKKTGQKLSLFKYLKQLQGDSYKLLKLKHLGEEKKRNVDHNNSGFMKPVRISKDLADFIGVDVNEPISRVEITKKLCQYIKENNLQNPDDKRIIRPDTNLGKLFSFTGEEDENLTYYTMQKKIQTHIFK